MNPKDFPLIDAYINELKTYNETTNIYSKGAYDKLDFHIQDCVNMAEMIGDSPLEVLDMGSGSGLPSAIIAICNPNNTVTAVESKSRKTRFLQQVKNKLQLNNYHVKTMDINQYIRDEKPEPDIITAKAFAPYAKLMTITKKLDRHYPQLLVPISQTQYESLLEEIDPDFLINEDPYYYIYQGLGH